MSHKMQKSGMFVVKSGDIKTMTGIQVNFDQEKIRERKDSSSEIKQPSNSRKRSSENMSRQTSKKRLLRKRSTESKNSKFRHSSP
jgi:hypothetical protein